MTHTIPETQQTIEPVKTQERIDMLDILRGFAIFGILVVNIAGMAGPVWLPGYTSPVLPWYDEVAETLVNFLALGKFYVIFSFLFGLGFSIQMARADEKGKDLRSFYPRRLWVLFALGLIHSTFFFIGDILRHYALLGFLLMVFRKRRDKTLLVWSGVFMVIGFITLGLMGGPLALGTSGGDLPPEMEGILPMARDIYTNGNFFQVALFQVGASLFSFVIVFMTQGGTVMAMFLLGLLVGRRQFFQRLKEHQQSLKTLFLWGLIFGVSLNAAFILFGEITWVSTFFWTLGAPVLGGAYIAGLCLLRLSATKAKWVKPLGNVGRMALTNYLMHSLVGALLFNGYGVGLYEQVGAAGLWGITILIFLAQIPFSAWWLSRFRFGPMEWLWRSLTYRRRQPFKRNQLATESLKAI